jgi:hypothetical protein
MYRLRKEHCLSIKDEWTKAALLQNDVTKNQALRLTNNVFGSKPGENPMT